MSEKTDNTISKAYAIVTPVMTGIAAADAMARGHTDLSIMLTAVGTSALTHLFNGTRAQVCAQTVGVVASAGAAGYCALRGEFLYAAIPVFMGGINLLVAGLGAYKKANSDLPRLAR